MQCFKLLTVAFLDGTRGDYTKWSNHIILLLYGIKKIIQMNIYENEIEPQTESNIITIGESGRRINEEFGIHIYTYIYKIGNKGPTV